MRQFVIGDNSFFSHPVQGVQKIEEISGKRPAQVGANRLHEKRASQITAAYLDNIGMLFVCFDVFRPYERRFQYLEGVVFQIPYAAEIMVEAKSIEWCSHVAQRNVAVVSGLVRTLEKATLVGEEFDLNAGEFLPASGRDIRKRVNFSVQ